MLKLPSQPQCCELCERPVAKLTRHHLIPRTLWVCRPCHNAIHKACCEYELGLHFNTREKLLELEELRRFADWLRDKPEGFVPKKG